MFFKEYTKLSIPQDKIEQMLERLITEVKEIYGELPVVRASSPEEKLLWLLAHVGYDAHKQNGEIVIGDCVVGTLDSENDPVLSALEGITPAGSYLTLYGDDNSQWQVRYDETRKWSVRGNVVFPQGSFPCEFQPGN